ncbi:GNAT family N-acetyltransferase [uncultured Clostridium sp.]|uniref:GNAT family N-acetyltransferase n=1 Tax=uncultured Clostridium sp. TaxID=59620 RepID=UPI0025D5743D|nr:GNAT family N-acetyltransferase [uncultured Clostridium sp.]
MIKLEKFQEKDCSLMNLWKHTYENEYDSEGILKGGRFQWKDRINGKSNCKYWVINNGGIKIGMVNLNHIDDQGCILEYYIGDIHFRGRNITSAILWNMYNYIFDELKLQYASTIIPESDQRNLNTHLIMGGEISGRFKENQHKNEKMNDMIYVLMKSEKWNIIKEAFNFEDIYIEKI